jgi:hypothetical protein
VPAHNPREDLEESFDPEDRPRGRNENGRYPGDDDHSQASGDDSEEERPPTDGRQPFPIPEANATTPKTGFRDETRGKGRLCERGTTVLRQPCPIFWCVQPRKCRSTRFFPWISSPFEIIPYDVKRRVWHAKVLTKQEDSYIING